MPSIIATRQDGESMTLDAQAEKTLMMAVRDGEEGTVDEQFGLCGGCCTCYKCHIWVDPDFLPLLPAMSAQEDDLLSLATCRQANSRLACRIPATDVLDGLRLTIPPID